MEFQEITTDDMIPFHDFMTWYYRDGEDKDTPQDQIDAFTSLLFQMLCNGLIQGRLIRDNAAVVGVVLWMKDTDEGDFSQLPGYGTILEIGVKRECRNIGIGKQIVAFAERQMACKNMQGYYVSAYGPAQAFWTNCGYVHSGKTAKNGLPILIKSMESAISMEPFGLSCDAEG